MYQNLKYFLITLGDVLRELYHINVNLKTGKLNYIKCTYFLKWCDSNLIPGLQTSMCFKLFFIYFHPKKFAKKKKKK